MKLRPPVNELVQLSGQQKLIGTIFEQFESKFPNELVNIFRNEANRVFFVDILNS